MNTLYGRALQVAVLVVGLSFTACKGPAYPKCDKDEHCAEKGEICQNGQCQECRDESQCQAKYPDMTRECVGGRCDPKAECRKNDDCRGKGAGFVCKGDKCAPGCTADSECGAGNTCKNNACVARNECTQNVECGPNRFCVDGSCQDNDGSATNISARCRSMVAGDRVALTAIYFDFDQFELTSEAREALTQNAECLKGTKFTLTVEGHADDRGTQEYNLALGDKRAGAVMRYLSTLGVANGRMRSSSKGENEPICEEETETCWSKNRRVQFLQR